MSFHETALRDFGAAVQRLIDGHDLGRERIYELFRETLLAEQPDLHQGALLAALRRGGHLAAHLRRQRILLLGLRFEKFLPPLEKLAVVPLHLERTLRIGRVELHHLRGDVLEKVPVVGDHQNASLEGSQVILEYVQRKYVEVVRGFIKDQEVWVLH